MEQCILGFDYCTPVCGVISSGFGYREHPIEGEEKFHYGIDLAADTGTEIRCFANGTVTAVGESSSYGKYLTVSHSGGYSTLYAHCSKVVVTSGTKVKEGQKIAEVGETGLATGPHLHFELHDAFFFLLFCQRREGFTTPSIFVWFWFCCNASISSSVIILPSCISFFRLPTQASVS